jgi:hypothetical protein
MAQDASLIKLITYLSGQNDFVSLNSLLEDKLSGFTTKRSAMSAIEKAAPLLEIKTDAADGPYFRLLRTFDGYGAVFDQVQHSDADVYNFLYSNYSHLVVNEQFIKESIDRVLKLPYFMELATKYPEGQKPGMAIAMMLAQSPGFAALAAMFSASPSVAGYLLFPGRLSKYELTHLKVVLDLAFATDMLKRVPPGTAVSIKYEMIAQGLLNLETSGGTTIP